MTKSPFNGPRCLPLRALDCFREANRERNGHIIGDYIWSDKSQKDLADEYGMTQAQVSYIVRKYHKNLQQLTHEESQARA